MLGPPPRERDDCFWSDPRLTTITTTALIDTIKNITRGDVSLPLSLDRLLLPPQLSCTETEDPRTQKLGFQLLTSDAQWKVLIVDQGSKKVLDNVVKEDDILNQNIASTTAPPWPSISLGTLTSRSRVLDLYVERER